MEHDIRTLQLPDDTLKAWDDHASMTNDASYKALIEFLHHHI